MKISRIDHLGIGVQSIEEVLPFFENVLGLKCYAIEEVADQKVKTAFLKVGETKIELLEPTSPESAVAKWLEKGGKGVHHVAFAVDQGTSFGDFHRAAYGGPYRRHDRDACRHPGLYGGACRRHPVLLPLQDHPTVGARLERGG